MHQNRFSVEATLHAPDTTDARPGLRLRIIAVVVVLLFSILGLRLWALQVAPGAGGGQGGGGRRDPGGARRPDPGAILDRYGNPLVNNVVT